MFRKSSRIARFWVFVVLGTFLIIGLTGFNQNRQDDSKELTFLRYLEDSGNVVALNPTDVLHFAEGLKDGDTAGGVLYLSREAATFTNKELLGSIYQVGILVVAIDTPISVLYEAVKTVPLGDSVEPITPRHDLVDLRASNDQLVVSMIYKYISIPHVNGYFHHTDFYAYPEQLELAAKAIISSSELVSESVDTDSLRRSEEEAESGQQVSSSSACGGSFGSVDASVTWTNGSDPGTSPRGKASCPTGFKPFHIRVYGTMFHDCDGWHQVGSLNLWNSTPYSVSEVSGVMTGFPYYDPPNSNQCGSGSTHKNPLFGTATVNAEARDYSPSALLTDIETSSKTVYYPL